MSLLSTLNRVSSHTPSPFIAPIFDAEETLIFTIQDDIPYHFKIRGVNVGWWEIIPTSNSSAGMDRLAQPWERFAYLTQLPRFYAIALFALSGNTWLAVPYNSSDANQRGWKNGEPRPVHLVTHNLKPFDIITTRNLAGNLLFETVSLNWSLAKQSINVRESYEDSRPVKLNRDWMNAYSLIDKRTKELNILAQREAIEAHKVSQEDTIRWHLEFMGARLNSWEKMGEDYIVNWEYDGCQYKMSVKRDMRIESAGICLSNQDSAQNLSSIVATMERARELNRFDLPEEYYK